MAYISILMPIYNGIEFIDESVSSVLNQTYDNWELIIGINGHPPNSSVYQTAKKYESQSNNIKVVDLVDCKGKSNALNAMVLLCQYDYVAILDVDDIWTNNKLEVQIPFLLEGINNYDVVGSQCVYFGDLNGIVPPIPLQDLSFFNFALVNPVINSSAIIRTKFCWWNAKYDGVEDYELWLRLRVQKCRFYNCPDVLVKHCIHNTSAFNGKDHSAKINEIIDIYHNNIGN